MESGRRLMIASRRSSRVHSRYTRRLLDLPSHGRMVELRVAARRFRQDLYYRLARAVVIVPPLAVNMDIYDLFPERSLVKYLTARGVPKRKSYAWTSPG